MIAGKKKGVVTGVYNRLKCKCALSRFHLQLCVRVKVEVYVLMLGASLHPASASLKSPEYYFFFRIFCVEVALSESFLLLFFGETKTFELQTNFVFKFNSKRC